MQSREVLSFKVVWGVGSLCSSLVVASGLAFDCAGPWVACSSRSWESFASLSPSGGWAVAGCVSSSDPDDLVAT